MATQVQFRGGSTAEHSTFTGAAREVTVDITKDTVVVHDGATAGGHALAKENGSSFTNVDINSGTIDGTTIGSASPAAITGTAITGTGLTVDGASTTKIVISSNDNTASRGLSFTTSSNEELGFLTQEYSTGFMTISSGTGTYSSGIKLKRAGKNAINIDGPTGDISFYEDLGVTPKFYWSASTERLGIGVGSSVGEALHVKGTGRFENSNATPVSVHVNSGNNDYGQVFASTSSAWKNLVLNQYGGNVGIGTSSPSTPLEVSGAAKVQNLYLGGGGGLAGALGYSDNSSSVIAYSGSHATSPNTLALYTGTAERLRITSTGSVGIGTASPATALDVTGTVTADGLTVDGTTNLQGTNPDLYFVESDTTDLNTYIANGSGNFTTYTANDAKNSFKQRINLDHATGDISFYEDTGTTPKFYWDASAESLGIGAGGINLSGAGTASQNVVTTIQGNSQFRGILELANTTGVSTAGAPVGDIAWFDNGNKIAQISGLGQDATNHDDGVLAFSTTSGGTLSERLRIDASGNVGIGTASPIANLHVNSGASNVVAKLSNSVSTYTNTLASTDLYFDLANAGAVTFRNKASYGESMRIDASGNLLVGKTAEGIATDGIELNRLNYIGSTKVSDVSLYLNRKATTGATAQFRYNNSIVGTISVTASATAYNTSSDYRLKEDIQPVANAADRLLQLKPINFAWKVDGSRTDGFLAHELQEVIPAAAHGTKDEVDADGNPVYQGIDQSKIVPLLTAALQEALNKIDALEARIVTLETKP